MEGIQTAICDNRPQEQDTLQAFPRWSSVKSVYEKILLSRTRGKP